MAPVAWKLTVRVEAKVQKSRYERMDDALDALESRARELAHGTDGQVVDVKIRRFEPVEQVVGRLELSGPERLMPKVRAGVDVRGDGSLAAYLGHVTREVVAEGKAEATFRALRRALNTSP
ncbi:MAG: hypothetical protein QOJ25_2481 [Solirubrobacteraceae bacterium]|jgi:hypothetical protein|nr:hypothetical protein [Solirubrobacteraceae bacterium]